MDIILVPTFNRPEFLYLCLERISQAHGTQALEVRVCQDKPSRLTEEIAGQMREVLEYGEGLFPGRFRHIIHEHEEEGNSFNFRESLRLAAQTASYVFLIEDDVLVTDDFFRWSYEMQKNEPRPLMVSGYHYSGPTAPNKRTPVFTFAVCFHSSVLPEIIHQMEPGFPLDSLFVNHSRASECVLPQRQRIGADGCYDGPSGVQLTKCFHYGWYGLTRFTTSDFQRRAVQPLIGTLEEKIEVLRKVVKNPLSYQPCLAGGTTSFEIFPFPEESLESLSDIAPVPPTPERFAEITNKVYEEEYDDFMDGYRQAARGGFAIRGRPSLDNFLRSQTHAATIAADISREARIRSGHFYFEVRETI